MEEMILQLAPSLEGQTTLLFLCDTIFILYFGSIVFNFFLGLFGVFKK